MRSINEDFESLKMFLSNLNLRLNLNLTWNLWNYSSDWNFWTIVTPFHKLEDKGNAGYYYPIPVFSVLLEIIEKAVNLQMIECLGNNALL